MSKLLFESVAHSNGRLLTYIKFRFLFSVLLQNIIEQIIEYNCAGIGPNNGHVLLFIGATDANEYATRISGDHHRGVGWIAFQLLSSMV